ncbi:nucleolar complex protein 14 [Coemansia sp. Benny D115]|nr:nucleolar complex protein 14 [Coemansia sp. Benny D115]
MALFNAPAEKGQKSSALKKLRSALSSAGITGPKSQVSKKDKKRGVRKAGNLKTAERRQKLRAIQTALNPFEMKVNRKKLDVLGLKRKDEVVNVAVARQMAVEKRKSTLAEERNNRNRQGGIVDRRIGENDPTMDPEEKMLQRFTMERQKRARSTSMYNLDDDDDVEGGISSLTHYGQSIDEMEDFDFNGADADDDEGTGAISKQDVEARHFGGFEQPSSMVRNADGTERKKTKAEVMQEIIAKSKLHKHERQIAKEQDEDIRRELDSDFDSLRALLFSNKDDEEAGDASGTADRKDELDQSYDTAMREFIFEKRARPQDRLKTEDEQAREEKERLERAERHRVRRMEGLDSSTESEGESDDGDEMRAYKTASKRQPVADDLGDDFAQASGDDDDDDEEESDGDEEEDDDEQSDEDDAADGLDQDTRAKEAERKLFKEKVSRAASKSSAKSNGGSAAGDELPFTFPAPTDYESWLELIADYTLEQQVVIIRRLRTLYHIRLSPQNKEKLSNLCIVLVEHLAVLTEQDPPVPAAIVDEIVKHIGELASVDAERFSEHCREAVVDCHRRVMHAIRASGNALETDAAAAQQQRVGPSALEHGVRASDIALMRLFISVFSSSDRHHVIITPMLMTICQYLSQYTFATLKDVAGGLVLVGLLHESQRLSRRFVPEALNFLFATLAATVCATDDPADWDGQFPLSRRQRQAYQILRIGVAEKCHSKRVEPVRWSWLVSDDAGGGSRALPVDTKYSILRACLLLCRKFIDCYFSLPAFTECFTPAKLLLAKISQRLPKFKLQQAPAEVSQLLEEVRSYLDEQLDQALASRAPLKLQYHKPLAIESVAPKFESNYSLDAHYDPDRNRNETIKLRRQVNKERRGVVRELRRDTQFLAGERQREQREKDKVYANKMKKAWSVLESDQSQLKKLDRKRIRERKAKI